MKVTGHLQTAALEIWREAQYQGMTVNDLKSTDTIRKLKKGELGINALATLMDQCGYELDIELIRKNKKSSREVSARKEKA